MKRILLLDTSVGSLNMGDEIIGRSIEMNWRELFSSNYVMRLATHTPMYTPAQYLLSKRRLSIFKGADIKLLCGTNALYTNMLRPLPTWNINYLNCGMATGTVCLGVGAGANSSSVNLYTRALYRKVLSHDLVHSVRDERTKHLLQRVGLRAWNTGCPTLWGLTPEHCETIARAKGDEVVFTLTSYHPNPRKDRAMVDVLRRAIRDCTSGPSPSTTWTTCSRWERPTASRSSRRAWQVSGRCSTGASTTWETACMGASSPCSASGAPSSWPLTTARGRWPRTTPCRWWSATPSRPIWPT